MVSISLPDGKTKKYESPVTGNQIAKDIAPSLLKKALVVEVNGKYKDLNIEITHFYSSYQKRAINTLKLILNTIRVKNEKIEESNKLISTILEIRDFSRKNKNYEMSDLIREKLNSLGIKIEDS